MTNRDKLAQMSNEEISQCLCNLIGGCDFCEVYRDCKATGVHGKGLKNWLESEVEES